jgi:hypothetical protein
MDAQRSIDDLLSLAEASPFGEKPSLERMRRLVLLGDPTSGCGY